MRSEESEISAKSFIPLFLILHLHLHGRKNKMQEEWRKGITRFLLMEIIQWYHKNGFQLSVEKPNQNNYYNQSQEKNTAQ